MRKLNYPSTTSFAGFFLIVVIDSTCLNDSILIKIKKPFTVSFFFKKPSFLFVTMMIVNRFGDLNFSIYPI